MENDMSKTHGGRRSNESCMFANQVVCSTVVVTSIKIKTAEVQKSRAYKPLTRFSFSLMKIREKKRQR